MLTLSEYKKYVAESGTLEQLVSEAQTVSDDPTARRQAVLDIAF